jgi:Peptidase_C39 like family
VARYNDLIRKLAANSNLNKTLIASVTAAGVGAVTPVQLYQASTNLSPVLSQRDNYTMPNRTCNSTANTMFLNYFRKSIGRQIVADDVYLASVLRRGDTIYHEVQTETLKAYGLDTYWGDDANWDRVRASLEAGYPVAVNILHRGDLNGVLRGGHIITLRGVDLEKGTIKVTDPYGLLKSNYRDYSSFEYDLRISEFITRWQGGYRMLTNTQARKLELADYPMRPEK